MAVTKIILDRQAESQVFEFGTTSASGEALVTLNKGTAAASTVVLDVKGSADIDGDLNLAGNLNITGAVNTQTVTNTNVVDVTITVNDGGSTPADDTAGILVEGTGNTVVGALKFKDASATKWSVGSGASQQDVVGTTATQTLSNKTLSSPTLTTPALGVASATSLALTSFLNEAKGADIASAGTTDIGAATGNYVHVTGTTTITALGTVQAGTRRIVRFTGALTLTHNGTSLILPTAANITTVANDTATFVSLGSGNWICVQYQRADGSALLGGAPSSYGRWTTVTGTQDSANKTFTIGNALTADTDQVFVNGVLLDSGATDDYEISGTTLTFTAGFTAPAATDKIKVYGNY